MGHDRDAGVAVDDAQPLLAQVRGAGWWVASPRTLLRDWPTPCTLQQGDAIDELLVWGLWINFAAGSLPPPPPLRKLSSSLSPLHHLCSWST